MTFGSLFAGIGGFDLGFERAGLECKWQVEIDDYATKVLEKHWPNVRRWRDVRSFPPRSYECSYSWRGCPQGPFAPDIKVETTRDEWGVDVICGGFPCQDISNAGKMQGINGERSGLWSEFARVIRVLRPRYAVVENVAALLVRGMDRVLEDLASLRYDAEWSVLSACQFGFPHARERLFLVAYDDRHYGRTPWPNEAETRPANVFVDRTGEIAQVESRRAIVADMDSAVYGIPGVVDQLRGYGNAVVPQVAEWIGRRILEESSST